MVLDAAHRASIYEKLRPVLGDEDANVLMSEFPSIEAQELVTRDFLRAELAITRGDLRSELEITRGDLRAELAELKSAMILQLGSALAACTAAIIGAFALFL